MAEYIEKEAVLAEVDKAFKLFAEHDDIIRLYSDARCSVIHAPAAEVDPVVHGRWKSRPMIVNTTRMEVWMCSICGVEKTRTSVYCPNCGARMDGE